MAVPLTQLTQIRPTLSLHRAISATRPAPAAVPSTRPVRQLGQAEPPGATELTSFVGRERAMTELRRLLDERRFLTLTGPGGIGKSRLARRLVAACGDRFSPVWTVDLGTLTDPALLPVVVASATGVRQATRRPPVEVLSEAIGTRRALLVLDQCEHLIDACANLAGDLLVACPGLHVLATSRDPLVAPGELAWPVPPLSLERRDTRVERRENDSSFVSDAVRLFL